MSLIFDTELGQVPVKQQLGFDQESFHVVVRQLVVDTGFDRHDARRRIAVQLGQKVGRCLVAHFDRYWRIAFDKKLLAEVLDHQQSGFAVGGKDCRRGKAAAAQGMGHRDEGSDVFRKMRDRAVRLAIAHGRAIRALRGIHENIGGAVAGQSLIAARGGVALNTPARCATVTGPIKESTHRSDSFGTRGEATETGDTGIARVGVLAAAPG